MSDIRIKMAKDLRDMSDMVGDLHWMAAKAVEDLIKKDARIAELEDERSESPIRLGRRVIADLRAELAAIKAQEPVMPEQIQRALDFSRNFADSKPDIGITERLHILGLANLLEKVARLNAAPVQQVSVPGAIRYTSDGELAECPCCGSLDVGGAHDTVNCYGCGLQITKPRPLQNAADAWNRRAMLAAAPAAPAADAELVEALEEWLADYDSYAADPYFEPFKHVAVMVAKTRAALAAHRAAPAPGGE